MWIFGTLTASATGIFSFVPFNKPIVGKIEFSLFGLTVRQNGTYLFDSEDSSVLSVVEVKVINFQNSGLYLQLTKPDGWGGINNDIVGLSIRFTATIS